MVSKWQLSATASMVDFSQQLLLSQLFRVVAVLTLAAGRKQCPEAISVAFRLPFAFQILLTSLNTGLKTSSRFCFFKSINEFPVNPQHHL